jgi:uncharacterized protein (TIGR02646 family)
MLKIRNEAADESSAEKLAELQLAIDGIREYEGRVSKAKESWAKKAGTSAGRSLFSGVRKHLADLCFGVVRCCYCEDSAADEIEHVRPKSFFPDLCFVWENFLFACGPCNGPKNDSYAAWDGHAVIHAKRKRKGPVVEPPAGISCLIDPRSEDATQLIELDIGGVTPGGRELNATFRFVERSGLAELERERAVYTIKTLRLNRDVLTRSRRNAFGGFLARISDFVAKKNAGAGRDVLQHALDDLVVSPHLTVFLEMRRQANLLPEIAALFDQAPELVALDLSGE